MEYQEEIAHRFFVKKDPIDQIIRDIHKQISSAGQTAVSVSVENVYKDSPESKHNVHTLMSSKNLGEAKRELQRVGLNKSFFTTEAQYIHGRFEAVVLPQIISKLWMYPRIKHIQLRLRSRIQERLTYR